MEVFNLGDHEYIELNKLLKILRWVNSGGEAHILIENGEVIVNGEVEYRKRKKLRKDDVVECMGREVTVQ